VKKNHFLFVAVCVIAGFCSSCQLIREDASIDGLSEEFVGMIHPGKYVYTKSMSDIDLNGATELFLNVSEEEAWEKYTSVFYNREEEPFFETEKYTLSLGYGAANSVLMFTTEYENAYESYSYAMFAEFMKYSASSELLRIAFPDEKLDSCTKEEALAFCYPYAKYLGYENAEAEVYAVTLDILESTAEIYKYGNTGAPVPGYCTELLTEEEYTEAYARGGLGAVAELRDQKKSKIKENKIPWSKKDEAFVIRYVKYYDGIEVEAQWPLIIVYAPQYEKPVLLQGSFAQEEIATMQADLPITSDNAVAKVLAYKGLDSLENIEIKGIAPVYGQTLVEEERLGPVMQMMPYWKIEYQLKNRTEQTTGADRGVIRVDAVYGEIN